MIPNENRKAPKMVGQLLKKTQNMNYQCFGFLKVLIIKVKPYV
jgi:hypothetical protein